MADLTETASTDAASDPVRSTQAVVLFVAALVAIPAIVLCILLLTDGTGSAGGGADVVAAIDQDQLQAVYLTNDQVYFGSVEEVDGDWVLLRDAFYLRRSATPAGEDADEQAAGLDLVPVSQDVGGDGDMVVNTGEISRIQDLADDAEIAREIEAALS